MITCYECGTGQNAEPSEECANCGERIGESCRDCSELYAVNDLGPDRRCDDCADANEAREEYERRLAVEDGRGDYLRDEGKDRRPW